MFKCYKDMKISPINFISSYKIQKQNRIKPQNASDCVSFSGEIKIQKTIIKDSENKDKEAVIIVKPDPEFKSATNFTISADSELIGKAEVSNRKNDRGLNLILINTKQQEKEYHGAGTALLRSIVRESYDKGYNGRVCAKALNYAAPPYAFYYKNNFKIPKDTKNIVGGCSPAYNIILDYIAKTGTHPQALLPFGMNMIYMELDEKGAQALLEGKRLYEERPLEKIAQTVIDDENYSAYIMPSDSEDEYYFAIINEDIEDRKLTFLATLRKEWGAYQMHDVNNHFKYYSEKIENFVQDTLRELSID